MFNLIKNLFKTKRVVLLGSGHYKCYREDGFGDSGMLFRSINPETGAKVGKLGEIRVGCRVQCGSIYSRSYSWQDWIMTSIVTDILSVNKDKTKVVFKTLNSIYTAESF